MPNQRPSMSTPRARPQRFCGNCGTPLSGRQRKWCKQSCAVAGWYIANREHRLDVQRRYDERKRNGEPSPAVARQRLLDAALAELKRPFVVDLVTTATEGQDR